MTEYNEKNNGFKIRLEDISTVEKKVFVEISKEHVDKQFESAYAEFKKHAHLKGFRKGHIPKNLIRDQYKKPISESVAEALIEESYKKACIENNVIPVSPLKLDEGSLTNLNEGGSFAYAGAFEIKPRLDTIHYDNLTVTKPHIEVTDDEVKVKLEALADNYSVLKDITEDRVIQMGDVIELEYVEQKEDWEKKPMSFEITQRLPKPILDALLGLKKGESVKLEIDKGRNVRCIAIKFKELPTIDDEFAKGLGEFKNLLELKESLKKDLLHHKEEEAMQGVFENITDQLIEKNTFLLPPSLIVQEVAYYKQSVSHLHHDHTHEGHNHEDHHHEEDSELEKRAVRNIKKLILIEAISKKENISVSDDELTLKLDTIAKNSKMDSARLKSYYAKNNLLEPMRGKLIEDKTFQLLYTKALMK